jgi:plastocyanin
MKLIAVAAAAAALAAPSAFAAATAPRAGGALVGTVGPGFTISLTQGGKKVTTLAAGTYTITVHDKSSIHDFHLTGPGVNQATKVPFTGTQTWKVTLKAGTYKYMCDPHASIMKGAFTVK